MYVSTLVGTIEASADLPVAFLDDVLPSLDEFERTQIREKWELASSDCRDAVQLETPSVFSEGSL